MGRYEQLITLGEGGMGTVYKAWDSKLKIHVAVKVLPTKLAASSNMVERFNREAQVLASLNLPGVVRIFDINQERGYHFSQLLYL